MQRRVVMHFLGVAGEGAQIAGFLRATGRLDVAERQFLYMPLMHSEERHHQQRCLEKFRELGRSVDFAERHAEIVFRFGRFPHRNAILGRTSTAEEEEFLKQPGSSF